MPALPPSPPDAPAGATAQIVGDVLVERYRYAPGPANAMPMHVHDSWQWCLHVGVPGSYALRSGRTAFASGTLSVVAPGEPHAAQDPEDRRGPAACLVAYVPPEHEPRHAGLVVSDRAAVAAFARLWPARERLEADVALARFVAAVRGPCRRREPAPSRVSVQAAREHLHAHATEPVALVELAQVAGLSPAHLVRAFGRAYGLPPHRYQTGLRIERAKRLLATAELTIGEIAVAVGFFDHAHFGRVFRRWVGFAPRRYAKIVQDGERDVRLDRPL